MTFFTTPLSRVLIVITLFIFSFQKSYTQHQYTWKELAFETPVALEDWGANDETSFDMDNDYFSVSLEIWEFEDMSSKYIKDPKFACIQAAKEMEVTNPNVKGNINGIKDSYYSIGFDFEETRKYPVITGVILDRENQKVYEIFIDCYEVSEKVGVDLIGTFKFNKK